MANHRSSLFKNPVFAKRAEENSSSSGDDSREADDRFVELPPGTLGRRMGLRLGSDHLRERFLRSIRKNDAAGVKQTLLANPDKQLFKSEDNFGTSSLEHAVLTKSRDIVEALLESYTHPLEKEVAIRRAMLVSIRQNDVDMVEYLLDEFHNLAPKLPDERKRSIGNLDADTDLQKINLALKHIVPVPDQKHQEIKERNSYIPPSNYVRPDKMFTYSISRDSVFEDAQYAEEISPVVLACQLERVEIVHLLFTKCSPDIHPLSEKCDEPNCFICSERRTFVGGRLLEGSRSAIEVFKALASPSFILHAAIDDPILEAFKLSDLMHNRSSSDPVFSDEYREISVKAESFAVDFLSLCRTAGEVQVLLSRQAGVEKTNTKGSKAIFPRLLLAMHYAQKEFVAHPNCQGLLENAWYEGLPGWVCNSSWHTTRMAMYGVVIFLLFPVLVPLYMMRVPLADRFLKPAAQRFLTDTVSYFFFVFILLIDLIFSDPAKRDELPTPLEWLVLVWSVGFMARYIKMTLNRRLRWCNFTYVENSNWRFYDLFLWLFFVLKFIFKFIAYGMAKHEIGGHPNDRRTWNQFDPFLWSEIFFAMGCIVALTQVYAYFKASRALGPLQLTMKKMMVDVLHFLILFGICISAFAFGITVLYRNYDGYNRYNLDDPIDSRNQDSAFSNLGGTYKTLFWSLFNYGDPTYADVVVGNEENRNVTVKHKLTEGVGYILYGAYNVISVIVLLNMLIAMMANSYEAIERNSDSEWKYARARMRMSYFNEIGCIPPPFNLVPLRKLVKLLSRMFCCRCCAKSCPSCCNNARIKRTPTDLATLERKHKDLMERLRRRYWKNRFAKTLDTVGANNAPALPPFDADAIDEKRDSTA